jgi:shikimate kinase
VQRKKNVYLIGPMGAGKTAVGRHVAKMLELTFYDSDFEIQKRTGVDIPFIFEKEGETGFREREREVIAALTELDGILLATGGGVVLDPLNRERLKATGTVVYLDTSVDEQLRRTGRSQHRPLLNTDDPRAVLIKLREIREPLYAATADIRIDTTGRRVRTVAHTVCALLKQRDTRRPLQN